MIRKLLIWVLLLVTISVKSQIFGLPFGYPFAQFGKKKVAPTITAQPSSVNVNQGSNTSFSVTATGSNLTYQWQLFDITTNSWVNITNAGVYTGTTTNTLTITGASFTIDANNYKCVVTGSKLPAATSNVASIGVLPPNSNNALFLLRGDTVMVGANVYLKDYSGNNRKFLITGYDWGSDYYGTDIKRFPFKTAATISAPVGDATLIAADADTFFYTGAGVPRQLPPQAFFSCVNYGYKIFSREVDHIINSVNDADSSIQGLELYPTGLKDIAMYSTALTSTDSINANVFYSIPAIDAVNTYWVAKNGNDGTGDGSRTAPFLTIEKARATINTTSGKTILVKNGNYTENTASTGSLRLQNLTNSTTFNITLQGVGGVYLKATSGNDILACYTNNSVTCILNATVNNIIINAPLIGRYPLDIYYYSNVTTNKLYIKSIAGSSYNTIYAAATSLLNINNSAIISNASESYNYSGGNIINTYINKVIMTRIAGATNFTYNKIEAVDLNKASLITTNNINIVGNNIFNVKYNIFNYGSIGFNYNSAVGTGSLTIYLSHNNFKRKYLNATSVTAAQILNSGTGADANVYIKYNSIIDTTTQDIPAGSNILYLASGKINYFDISNNNITSS
jgi:hypothetical protein